MSAKRTTSSLLIDEQPLQVVPSLACKIGLNRATFLQQLHYWLQKPGAHQRDGRRWVFNTYEEWHEQFPFWSVEAIKKLVLQLEQKNIIITTDKYNKRGTDRTKWYTIDYEILSTFLEDSEGAKSNVEREESNALEGAKSAERYQRVPETNDRDSRRDAEASPEATPEDEKPTNYMDVFTDAAKMLGYEVTNQDRKELPGNFKHLRDSGKHDDEFMRTVVRRCLAARADRQYPLSPQTARDELLGNVRQLHNGKGAPQRGANAMSGHRAARAVGADQVDFNDF